MSRPHEVNPARVAAYIRWSTDEQSDGTTLEVQTEACRHYILAQGWDWDPDLVFVDDGCSGGNLDRPALDRLRRAVRDGRVSCVVVFKLDRLSRNVVDTVNLVLQEWECRCHVKSTREPVDTTTPSGKMFFYMLASYAEWERSVIRERTMAGKVKRAQQGRNPGFTPPFGYRPGTGPGEWQVSPVEAEVVRRIFREYLAGQGIRQVAARLNAEGIPPRRGRRWHATTISLMLRNAAYTGVLAYGRTGAAPGRAGRSRVVFDQPRFARVEGALPPIIPPETFDRVQAVLRQRGGPRGRRALGSAYLLSGIVRCLCGSTLRGDVRPGKGVRYYRCTGAGADPARPCAATLLPADALEQAVTEQVKAAFDRLVRARLLARLRLGGAREAEAARAALRQLHEQRGALARRRQRLDADYDAGELGPRVYTERVRGLEEEQAALERRVRQCETELARLAAPEAYRGPCERMARQIDIWHPLDGAQRKQVLRHLVRGARAYRRPRAAGEPGPHPVEAEVCICCPPALFARRAGRPRPDPGNG